MACTRWWLTWCAGDSVQPVLLHLHGPPAARLHHSAYPVRIQRGHPAPWDPPRGSAPRQVHTPQVLCKLSQKLDTRLPHLLRLRVAAGSGLHRHKQRASKAAEHVWRLHTGVTLVRPSHESCDVPCWIPAACTAAWLAGTGVMLVLSRLCLILWGCHRLNVAANGVAYCPPEARQGILPRLLNEILTTRIMVPSSSWAVLMSRLSSPITALMSGRTCTVCSPAAEGQPFAELALQPCSRRIWRCMCTACLRGGMSGMCGRFMQLPRAPWEPQQALLRPRLCQTDMLPTTMLSQSSGHASPRVFGKTSSSASPLLLPGLHSDQGWCWRHAGESIHEGHLAQGAGAAAHPERAPVRPQNDRQCQLRLHGCRVLWAHAHGRAGRLHCPGAPAALQRLGSLEMPSM